MSIAGVRVDCVYPPYGLRIEQRISEMRKTFETQKRLFEEASTASVQTASLSEGEIELF